MPRIQQSIDINVPAPIVYNQLVHFEAYPRFMQGVKTVHQIDDKHLHWTTRMGDRDLEWDAVITEYVPDRCIAWNNTSGPANAGKMEVQAVGPEVSRVTLMLDATPEEQMPSSPIDNMMAEMSQRIEQDLARLKILIETRGSKTVAWHGASSEVEKTMQSDYSLSQASDDDSKDQQFSVAEEVNLDQQSGTVRHVGQLPQDTDTVGSVAPSPSETMAQSMQQDEQDAKNETALKKSIERAVPPSPDR